MMTKLDSEEKMYILFSSLSFAAIFLYRCSVVTYCNATTIKNTSIPDVATHTRCVTADIRNIQGTVMSISYAVIFLDRFLVNDKIWCLSVGKLFLSIPNSAPVQKAISLNHSNCIIPSCQKSNAVTPDSLVYYKARCLIPCLIASFLVKLDQ